MGVPSSSLSDVPSVSSSLNPSGLPSFPSSVCADDQDFGFSYTDLLTNVIVESCSDLFNVDAGTRLRACREKFPYPDDGGEETKIKEICHLSCENCPYRCEDDNSFEFEYTIEDTGVSVGTCSELAQLDGEDQDEVCGDRFMFPDETGKMKKLKKICISTCRNCPLYKPPTPLPTSLGTKLPPGVPSSSLSDVPSVSPSLNPSGLPSF